MSNEPVERRTWYFNNAVYTSTWILPTLEANGNPSSHKKHHDTKPACREWYDNGQIAKEEWCQNGLRHREGKPAITTWYPNGTLSCVKWYQNGLEHREPTEGPSYQHYSELGHLVEEEWRLNGNLQWSEDIPSSRLYYPHGTLRSEKFIEVGKNCSITTPYQKMMHRTKGASNKEWHRDGKPYFEEWRRRGDVFHREDGPAYVKWNTEGNIEEIQYFLQGEQYTNFWEFYENTKKEARASLIRDWHPDFLPDLLE